jgi:hypothetical protein
MKNLIFSVLVLAFSATVQAQEIQFGEVGYGGTGCPAGKQPAFEVYEQFARVTFNGFAVSAGSKDPLINRQSCNLRIPISIPAGQQVGVRLKNLIGQVAQAKRVQSNVQASVSLVGSPTVAPLVRSWSTKTNSNFQVDAGDSDVIWSNCDGRDAMLAINSAALVNRAKASASARLSIDTLNLEFVVRACNELN